MAPATGDNVFLTQNGATDITVEYFDPAPEANLNTLRIDGTGGGMMTLSQSLFSHNLFAANETVGDNGTGQVLLANGTHTVTNDLILGNSATGNGSFTTSNGTSLSAGDIFTGNSGTGTLTIQSGSTVSNTIGYIIQCRQQRYGQRRWRRLRLEQQQFPACR